MSSPAVVILTEPTHCASADGSTLAQALLQVQQLGEAGVPVSQAFCDHPSEAMKFIDAYARAYPELQMQSSDLPLPEHLYSMMAEGRLSPLQGSDAPRENANLEEAARLQSLYVLSLGAPDALMQALQDNGVASNGIKVLEIPPIEDLSAGSVSVAEAVAARPLVSSSWLAQSSASAHVEEQPLEAPDNAPLELESVELDLDDIEVNEDDARSERSAPSAAVVDTKSVTPAADSATAKQPDAPAEDEEPVADREPQPASTGAAKDEPAPEARESSRTERVVADSGTAQDDTPADNPTPPEKPPAEGTEEPPDEAGAKDDADTPAGDGAEGGSGSPDDALVAPNAPAEGGGRNPIEDGRHDDKREIHSFSDASSDVLYPSPGLAADDDDLLYPLPSGGDLEPGTLEYVLGLADGDDVVDLEAMGRHLHDPADNPAARPAPLDPVLTRPPQSDGRGADGSPRQDTPADSVVPYSDRSEPDDGADHNKVAPIVHDLEI